MTITKLFKGRPGAYKLFQLIEKHIKTFGAIKVEAKKTQVSFSTTRKFAWVWLPQMWIRKQPQESITLTFALKCRIRNRQIKKAVEPYPGRWTHHVVIERPANLTKDVRMWLREAYEQAAKGPRRPLK